MGLDMYLTKKTYVENWPHMSYEEKYEIIIKKGGEINKDIQPERITYIIENIAYWRKANAIHKWFVDNIQDGVDDCKEYYININDIKKLIDVCKQVKESLEFSYDSGNVSIELSEDEENPDFVYYKNAQAEWSESFTNEVPIELTEKEVEFVRSKVLNLVGSQDGDAINYKGDCILNNEEEQISDTISQKISDFVMNHEFENAEGEAEEWFQYNTDQVDSDVLPKIVGNTLFVSLTRQFLVYTDSEL
jgi:hypothetical protein